jgi:hypothetical protein
VPDLRSSATSRQVEKLPTSPEHRPRTRPLSPAASLQVNKVPPSPPRSRTRQPRQFRHRNQVSCQLARGCEDIGGAVGPPVSGLRSSAASWQVEKLPTSPEHRPRPLSPAAAPQADKVLPSPPRSRTRWPRQFRHRSQVSCQLARACEGIDGAAGPPVRALRSTAASRQVEKLPTSPEHRPRTRPLSPAATRQVDKLPSSPAPHHHSRRTSPSTFSKCRTLPVTTSSPRASAVQAISRSDVGTRPPPPHPPSPPDPGRAPITPSRAGAPAR